MHQSHLRPNGFKLINNYVKTLYRFFKSDFKLYLFDNASVDKYKIPRHNNIEYTYVENQMKRGVTGPWNDGVIKAIKDNCDMILITNDDILFNNSVNTFVNSIKKHEYNKISLYGPLSDGMLKIAIHQKANKKRKGIKDITKKKRGFINGFFMGFTREFYERFKLNDGKLFNERYRWRYQEISLQKRVKKLGGKLFIIEGCWIHHDKIRGWENFGR